MKSVKFELNGDEKLVALAVSGGADSMFMAMAAERFLRPLGVDFIALIVDHGLRPESREEALWVQQYLSKKHINSKVLSADIKVKPQSNVQKIARDARYKALSEYCMSAGIKSIFTAHNMDDQAETLFIKMERGSGLDGACGISANKLMENGLRIKRPMLEISRAEIEQELQKYDWQWVQDPSNFDSKYRRVSTRNFLQAYDNYPELIERFSLFINNMQCVQDFVESEVMRHIQRIAHFDNRRFVRVDLPEFLQLHTELQLRILIKLMHYITGDNLKPRLRSSNKALAQIFRRQFAFVLQGCEIVSDKDLGYFYIFRELGRMQKNIKISELPVIYAAGFNQKPERFYVYDNVYHIPTELAEAGYKVSPMGMERYSEIKSEIKLEKIISHKIYLALPYISIK